MFPARRPPYRHPEGPLSLQYIPQFAKRSTKVLRLLDRPLLDLVFEAAAVHRMHHEPGQLQCSQLLSIKTGSFRLKRTGDGALRRP